MTDLEKELSIYNCKFEFVQALGYYCLIKNGKIIYKDIDFIATLNDLIKIAKKNN